MTPNDFVYWLQGYVELNGDVPTEQQWEVIKDHLQLVMDKKTPVRNVVVETNSLREHMEKIAEQFKDNPEWQQQLLRDKLKPSLEPQINC